MKLYSKVAMFCFALSPLVSWASDAEQSLRSLLTKYDGFSAQFEQTVTDSDGNLINQAEGELKFKQPGKFVWQVNEPEEESLISNGKTLWWLNMFIEQVSIFDSADSVAKTPFALLVSDDDSVWQRFDIAKAANGYEITPKALNEAQVIKLEIGFEKDVLSEIKIVDRTRQLSVYSLADQAFTDVNDAEFELTIPLGIDVDDQRNLAPQQDGNVQF